VVELTRAAINKPDHQITPFAPDLGKRLMVPATLSGTEAAVTSRPSNGRLWAPQEELSAALTFDRSRT
jgi:hypothetical protein